MLEFEPIEAIRSESEKVWSSPDRRELRVAQHLDRHQTGEGAEIELDRLNGARQIYSAQNDIIAVAANVHEHLLVGRLEKLHRPPAKDLELLPKANHVPHPVQQGRSVTLLGLDADGLIAVHGIHDDRAV